MMRIQVVYALAKGYDVTEMELAAGSTVEDALEASGIATRHPAVDLSRVGIFGRRVGADAPLCDGDRVEIYRPLALDPKEARRERAKRNGKRASKRSAR